MAEPAIKKAITVLDMLSRDPATVRMTELRMKQILDEKSMIEGAKEEGLKEGLKEGVKKSKLETARNALSKGMDISLIAEITGLSEEEVQKLKLDM